MSSIFPRLTVLKTVKELSFNDRRQIESILSHTVFVCVQHILSTTGSLFESLIELGAKPSNIFILGKCYSTSSKVLWKMRTLGIDVNTSQTPSRHGDFSATIETEIRELWQRVYQLKQNLSSKKIIVIDDGGKCLNLLPSKFRDDNWQIVGIEQTTSGLKPEGLFEYPLIEVASSSAKRCIESPMIAEAVSKRICYAAASIDATRYGVVGYGNIGKAVAAALSHHGYQVSVYDRSSESTLAAPPNIIKEDSIRSLIANNQFILGCTGNDIIPYPDNMFKDMPGQKIFASCSSGDYEFNQLLKVQQLFSDKDGKAANTLHDLEFDFSRGNNSPRIKILRGGFPVNFDGSPESVPAADIQLTRGLLLGAVIQGALYFEDYDSHKTGSSNHKMLDPYIQRMVVDIWQRQASYKSHLVEKFQDIEWIETRSGGKRSDSRLLKDSYSPQYSSV